MMIMKKDGKVILFPSNRLLMKLSVKSGMLMMQMI